MASKMSRKVYHQFFCKDKTGVFKCLKRNIFLNSRYFKEKEITLPAKETFSEMIQHQKEKLPAVTILPSLIDGFDEYKFSINENRVVDPQKLEDFLAYHRTVKGFPQIRKAMKRDTNILLYKVHKNLGSLKAETFNVREDFSVETDVLIVGGGGIGSSIAYFLKDEVRHALQVTVVEKDTTYAEASTALSVGGLRTQFSIGENVLMSLYGAEFLRKMPRALAVPGFPAPDPKFEPYGYLLLATHEGADALCRNALKQSSLGAKNELLTADKLKAKFPWLNVDDIAVGCLGIENEGWFDPWSLLNGLKQKALHLGANYVQGEVVGFEFMKRGLEGFVEVPTAAIIQMKDNNDLKKIKFRVLVIAAGADSAQVAALASIGLGDGILACPLPVERRKRYVYAFHCPDGPGINTPLVIDPSGAYFRREGLNNYYIAGASPSLEDEPDTENLDVDYSFYEDRVWPSIANRVPCFENSKLQRGWAGFYEYNYIDQNAVIGRHPKFHDVLFACGFSGHGIQHVPAVGRGIMELIVHDKYQSINLERFSFHRLGPERPLLESGIY